MVNNLPVRGLRPGINMEAEESDSNVGDDHGAIADPQYAEFTFDDDNKEEDEEDEELTHSNGYMSLIPVITQPGPLRPTPVLVSNLTPAVPVFILPPSPLCAK